MAWHRQGLQGQRPHCNHFAVLQQVVELAAVGGKAVVQVEDGLEDFLNLGDGRANGDLAAQDATQVVRGRQVVGMRVGFQKPLHGELLRTYKVRDLVRRGGAGAPRLCVVVQHRVHNGAVATGLGVHHVAHGPGGWIEKRLDGGDGMRCHGMTLRVQLVNL